MSSHAFTLLEKARLSEWIGDAKNALVAYNNTLELQMTETFHEFIEPIIMERLDRLKQVKDSENETIYNDVTLNFKYSIRVIDRVQSQVFVQIRAYDEKMRHWDTHPLPHSLIEKLFITHQFPPSGPNKNYDYQDDILLFQRVIDEMAWYSFSLDKNGIILGEAVVNEKDLPEATKYINYVLKTLDSTHT